MTEKANIPRAIDSEHPADLLYWILQPVKKVSVNEISHTILMTFYSTQYSIDKEPCGFMRMSVEVAVLRDGSQVHITDENGKDFTFDASKDIMDYIDPVYDCICGSIELGAVEDITIVKIHR